MQGLGCRPSAVMRVWEYGNQDSGFRVQAGGTNENSSIRGGPSCCRQDGCMQQQGQHDGSQQLPASGYQSSGLRGSGR